MQNQNIGIWLKMVCLKLPAHTHTVDPMFKNKIKQSKENIINKIKQIDMLNPLSYK